MSTELTIISPEGIALMQSATQLYNSSKESHDKCLAAGERLKAEAECNGMSDSMDERIANFLAKAKNTVKKLNDNRSPITRTMDEVKKVFVALENEMDVTKTGNVIFELQQMRNQYAANKRLEAERKRLEEQKRLLHQQAMDNYRAKCEANLCSLFSQIVAKNNAEVFSYLNDLTLDNYQQTEASIRAYPIDLPAGWSDAMAGDWSLENQLTSDEVKSIREGVIAAKTRGYAEQYSFEMQGNRDEALAQLPHKFRALQDIAKAGAEEAERKRAELEAAQAELMRAREAARLAKEEEERARVAAEAERNAMNNLFDAQMSDDLPAGDYNPKSTVKKRIRCTSFDGYMVIVAKWMTDVASRMSEEEIRKALKVQITYAEKIANGKEQELLQSPAIIYEDEVKAR